MPFSSSCDFYVQSAIMVILWLLVLSTRQVVCFALSTSSPMQLESQKKLFFVIWLMLLAVFISFKVFWHLGSQPQQFPCRRMVDKVVGGVFPSDPGYHLVDLVNSLGGSVPDRLDFPLRK